MGLTNEIISEFVKSTKDETKYKSESTVNGTTVEYDGRIYVRIDGSDVLTPVSKTVDVKADERVTVAIKDHTATITGNISSPSARTDDVKDVASKMTEVEILTAYKVTTDDLTAVNAAIEKLKVTNAYIDNIDAIKAEIESLEALFVNVEHLTAKDIQAITAKIESVEAIFGTFTDISTEDLEAINAEIGNLKAYTADFTYVSAEVLEAVKASIKTLEAEKLSAVQADLKYANIDFSNIDKAAMEYFYANSGLIHNVQIGDATISGRLVGVTITGDLIEGGTIVADKLAIKGDDGLYYKLNVSAYDTVCYEVKMDEISGEYTETDLVVEPVNGHIVDDIVTINGDRVYLYTTEDGEEIHYIKTFVYNGERVDVDEVPRDSLNGSNITANSITAEKISVNDLVAFGATIGGFELTESSLYSGIKETIDNTTRGIYMDKSGQLNIGDETSYIKFYKDSDGMYRLAISADSILFSKGGTDLLNVLSYVRIDPNAGSISLGGGTNSMSLSVEHDIITFSKGTEQFGWWDGVNFHTGNIKIDVTEKAQFGNFAYVPRSDGSLSFLKVSNDAGFYCKLNSGVMRIYGSYPTLTDTTLTIGDTKCELIENTLVLGV